MARASSRASDTLTWHPLGGVSPQDLSDARQKIHRAAQWVARIAHSYYPSAEDDSHSALIFHPPSGAAGLAPVNGGDGEVIPALIFPEMALALSHDTQGRIIGLRDLNEVERAEAVRAGLTAVGLDVSAFRAKLPYEDEIPQTDDAAPDVLEAVELTRYYANFSTCLDDLSDRHRCISPTRLWPHHFDLARLVALDDGPQTEDSRSIGIGLAPDDAAYDQPYLYIAPWPPGALPPDGKKPTPPAGLRWHRGTFTALVATAEEMMLGEQGRAQVDAAIDAGVALCRALLLETRP